MNPGAYGLSPIERQWLRAICKVSSDHPGCPIALPSQVRERLLALALIDAQAGSFEITRAGLAEALRTLQPANSLRDADQVRFF